MLRRDSAVADVVIVGAGLVGLALSTFLAKSGLSVRVLEAYEDPRTCDTNTARSIGLTLSTRAIRSLDTLGVGPLLGHWLVPVVGRCVHFRNGDSELQRYALVGDDALYSIRRTTLLRVLCSSAIEAGVDIRFRTRCKSIDAANSTLALIDSAGEPGTLGYQRLICADGARSALRTQLGEQFGVQTRMERHPQAFKEINFHADAARKLDRHALHVWPRDEQFLIALPNIDGSFSGTVFTADGPEGIGRLDSRETARQFLEREFPEIFELAPDADAEFVTNPIGRMITIECDRWSYPGSVLIAGDAAHAMPPFFGQGLNSALEGCQLLVQMLAGREGSWESLFDEFERRRKPDVEAIWTLSHTNRTALSRKVAEASYRRKRDIEAILEQRFPDHFLPLYAMIAFSTLPYSQAVARAARQDALVELLMAEATDSALLESVSLSDVTRHLALLPEGARCDPPGWLPRPGATGALSEGRATESRGLAIDAVGGTNALRAGVPERRVPLTFSQERIWFFEKFWPEDTAYSMSLPQELHGPLDLPALQNAMSVLVARHEALRTRILEEGGEPWQVIDPPGSFAIERAAYAGPEPMTSQRVRHTLEQVARQRIPLSGPLFRCLLWKFSDAEHLLVLRIHHIIADRYSLGIIIREWSALYAAFLEGRDAQLAPVACQLADYASLERAVLSGERLARGLAFWRERLAHAPALDLPLDRPRPAAFSNNVAVFAQPLLEVSALRDLAARSKTTRFTAALACYAVLLSRWAREQDVSIGCVVSNRSHPSSIDVVGCLFNTVVIRCLPTQTIRFDEFLRQVRKSTSEALAWQSIPVDAVAAALGAGGDRSRPPLYQVMFTYRSAGSPIELPRLASVALGQRYVQATTEISLEITDSAAGASIVCQYNSDLFDRATIARLVGQFNVLIASAVASPTARLCDLEILTQGERRQLLCGWNQTRAEFPTDCTLHELFERQVEQTPDAEAARMCGSAGVTYRDLNERANRLAHLLCSKGVRAGSRVAIAMHRSLDLVTALLAVMKAGAAYVPLDPGYPGERVRYMLADASPLVVLTSAECAGLVAGHDLVLSSDSWEAASAGFSGQNLPPERVGLTLSHPAYVIYTSGSTGQPKGAINSHRGIVNRILWMQSKYGIGSRDRVLQKTPYSFDVSVWEFFWPLTTGATLVLAAPEAHRDAGYIAHAIAEERISVIHFVPSMLRAFLEWTGPASLASLRHVICSGEALTADLVERFYTRSASRLHNLYGPTEAAVDVTSYECHRSPGNGVPIGRPVANSTCYVLDEHYEPVPIGVPGELCIGGVQVGIGYLNRPGLTAQRFTPDPFAGSGGRLYRTGDVVRVRADGNIEFLGRNDDQVKIRGFRIEPGEVEASLLNHPLVSKAVVTVHTDGPDEHRLVAYVVPNRAPGEEVPESERAGVAAALREHLAKFLPEYMVPANFVLLNEIPLGPSGKVERRALVPPDRDAPSLRPYVPPQTETERVLVEIWQEVLRCERVGVEDGFFELGGYSLLATRAIARIQNRLRVSLPMRAMFQSASLRELAQLVEREAREVTDFIPPLVARKR